MNALVSGRNPHIHLLVGAFLFAGARLGATCYESPFAACPNNDAAKATLIASGAFPTTTNSADSRPMAFIDAGDGSRRRYVPLLGGRILVWAGGASFLATDFLDLSAKVRSPGDSGGGGEQGLLALAFHPDYATNGYFYVKYVGNGGTAPSDSGDIVIQRYTRSAGDPNVADAASAQTILVIDHEEGQNHDGGWLAFGPDGFLYISTGDGGSGCDETIRDGQSTTTLRGKLLRIDVDSASAAECNLGGATGDGNYAIPAGNPFRNPTAGCGEIWAMGLRNPFRFTFDRENGDLFVGDVGQDNWEELNYISSSSEPPLNFGWVCREGCDTSESGASSCNDVVADANCSDYTHITCEYPSTSGYMDPNLCFSNPDGWVSIIAGYRYRGEFVSSLADRLLLSDASKGEIWQTPSNDLLTASCWDGGNGGLYAFGEDHLGELYIVNGGAKRIECIHGGNPDGCYWAKWGGIFEDDFESPSHDTSHWSDTVQEP